MATAAGGVAGQRVPAITVGRMFSDTFAGIAPSSVPPFVAAQIIGGALGVLVIMALYPRLTPAEAAEIAVPHRADQAELAPSGGGSASRPPP